MNILTNNNIVFSYAGLFSTETEWIHPKRTEKTYEIICVTKGKVYMREGEHEYLVEQGQVMLLSPNVLHYGTRVTSDVGFYWVHFTGNDVTNILRYYGFTKDKHVYYCGKVLEYQNHFRLMIQELQMCKEHYAEMLEMHLREIFIMIHRHLQTRTRMNNSQISEDIDAATLYFNEHYNEEINIEEYAQSHNMSTSWFIRNFKQYTGFTPLQYILSVRIYNAEALLKSNMYNITEVASIVGYDNPLYFSRTFKKLKGISPSEYRNSIES